MRGMDWLNYHHLYYFWIVAREGSIAAASRRLLLSPPTISAQIRELEAALGAKLFKRVGRSLALNELGRLAARYADEIFALGQEFTDIAKGRTTETSLRFRLGVDDVLPKTIVSRLLEPVLRQPQAVHVVCVEGTQAQLLPALAVHDLDLVLSDAPPDPTIKVRAFGQLIGESGLTLCAAPKLARQLQPGFPKSLNDAPALLPTANSWGRRAMEQWFQSVDVRPRRVAEFEDAALLQACGLRGLGFFALPDLVAREFASERIAKVVGHMGEARVRFYAISVERRLRHPAAVVLVETAAHVLPGDGVRPRVRQTARNSDKVARRRAAPGNGPKNTSRRRSPRAGMSHG